MGEVLLVGAAGAEPVPRRILSVRFHQRRPILGARGDRVDVGGREPRGLGTSTCPQQRLGRLPEGTFHHHELIGCEVRDRSDALLGRVSSVEGPMERSRLVVEGQRGEIQIPLRRQSASASTPRAADRGRSAAGAAGVERGRSVGSEPEGGRPCENRHRHHLPGDGAGAAREGIVGRAAGRGVLDIRVHDLRDHTTDRHRVVDDVPFGGGPGMVLKPEPLFGPSRRFAPSARHAARGDTDDARTAAGSRTAKQSG